MALTNRTFLSGRVLGDSWRLREMRAGGLTAANCTVSIWEGLKDTLANIAEMQRLIRANSDLLTLVRSIQDIDGRARGAQEVWGD